MRMQLPVRLVAAAAAIGLLCGSVVVSCEGDPPGATGSNPADRPASLAFGLWTPPTAQGTETICSKALHDSKFVLGPDGKKYPTWHPPTGSENGVPCVYGHDHGTDPAQYDGWDDVRRHFAFDTNSSGVIDDSELAASGIPFGYVNEQGGATLTEKHESYKIVTVDDQLRTRQVNGQQARDLTCDLLLAFNQDTASAEAFTLNQYSAIYAAHCTTNSGSVLPAYRAKLIASAMVSYGSAGVFLVVTEPSDARGRQIPTRERARTNILVESGQTSDYARGLEERWNGAMALTRSDSTPLATIDVGVATRDPIRYVSSLIAPTLLNSIELCYQALDASGNEVASGGVRQARGGLCAALPGGSGPGVAVGSRVRFGDKESAFRGCDRAAYFAGLAVRNLAGPSVWYTDVTGAGGRSTSFAGGVKQFIDLTDTGSSVLLTERAISNSCSGSPVRAPN